MSTPNTVPAGGSNQGISPVKLGVGSPNSTFGPFRDTGGKVKK